jgi:hypothetical protein
MANEKVYVGEIGAKELYRRIKRLINNFGGFEEAEGTGADNHPSVLNPSTKIIYLVPIDSSTEPNKFTEWYYHIDETTQVASWEKLGVTNYVENSWKHWSEVNGSTSADSTGTSVYIGKNNTITDGSDGNHYVIGANNSITFNDGTDYTGTYVSLFGQNNTATNAANAYQLGRDNRVTGNNLAYADKYPYSLAMNLGRNNIITGEGLNLGKNNIAANFGVTLGQDDKAYHGSVAIGNRITSSYGSIAIGNGDSEPDAMTEILSLNVGGKFYPAEKIKANVWPTYAHAATKLMPDGKYHWVEAISWPSGVYWYCYVNNELGQYLVTRNGGSSSGRYTGYFDDNGNFIASSDPSHNIHTYTIITQVRKADRTDVSTSFYASLDDSNHAITTSYKSLYVGGYSGEVPDGGTILTQAEYDMLDAGMVDSRWVFSQLQINPNDDTYAIENHEYDYKYFDTVDVYGYDTDDGFMPYNFMNKDEEHEFYWKPISMDNIVNSPYKATDLFEPSSSNLISAIHNSIALGKNQEVRSSSIGIAAPLLDALDLTNIASQKTGRYYLGNINFTQYPINQTNGQAQISTVSKSYFFNAGELSGGTYDLSFTIAQVPAAKHYVDGGSVGIFDRSDSSASRIESGSMGLGAGISANGNSFAIGHHGISASGGSFAAGFANSTASGGSIAIGNSTASASNGSFVFGNNGISADAGSLLVGSNGSFAQRGSAGIGHNLILSDGSYSIGNHNSGSFGAITVGVNAAAANGGVHLSTSNFRLPSLRTAYGTLINYTNPDGVRVPVIGSLSLKTGYTITKVRLITGYRLNTVEYRVVLGEYSSGGSFNSYSGYYRLYDMSGNYYDTASMDDSMRSLLYHSTDNNYWRIYDSTTDKYTFIQVDQNHSAINNLSALKQYYKIQCQTFTQDNQLYVYANGFDYPTSGLTDTLIDLSACNFTTEQQWQGVSLGYTESNWKQLTDIGAYGSGVAIGRQAHSYGSSLSLATNNGDDQANNTVTVENEIMSPDEVPNGSVGIRIKNNYTSANGYSLAFGSNVTAQGSSLVIGYGNTYAYVRSLSIGFDYNHAESNSFAIGFSNNYAFGNSFAIGKDYNSATGNSFAVGLNNNKASGNSMAIGWSNSANDLSYVLGAMCEANNHSTAFGDTASAFYNSFACGHNATASDYAVALGRNSTAYSNSVAVGISTIAKDYSINVGRNGTTAKSGVAFGENNVAIRSAIALGISNTAQDKTVLVGQNNFVNNDGAPSGALVGHDNSMTADGYNTAFGDYNTVSKEAVAIGFNNKAYGWSIAVGSNNRTAYVQGGHATLIGHNNISTSDKETVNWESLTPSGTSRSSTYYFPTTSYQPYGITQQIYTASDLHNVSGTISKIAFKVVNAQNNVRNLKIYIGTTVKNTFSWAPYYDDEWPGSNDWVPISAQTLVYNGNVTFTVGTVEIPLTTSFVLPENTNIVVTVVDNTGSTSSSLAFTCLLTGKTGVSLKYQSETPIDTSDLSQYMAGEYPDQYSGVNGNQVAIIFTIGNQTVITDVMDGLSGEVSTNSILMGEQNTSNHWNSMLFGVGNTSLAPLPEDIPDSEHPYDHDDGFVLAIGRENVVGRNYDIAIGYKSVANGGENIAIGNSKAVGYRNIAMVNSDIIGISNIGLMESSLTTTLPVMYYGEGKNVRNVLLHGKLNHSGPELIENIVINSGADLTIKQSCSGNVFYNVDRRATSGYYDDHDVYHYYDTDISLSIDAYNIVDNVFWGMYVNEGGSITCRESANKNFVINSMPVITRAKTLTNNLFLDSVVTLDNVSDILSNTVIHGRITGTNCATRLIGNHIGTECCLNIDNNTSDALVQNFLENGSSLTAYTEDPIVNRCDGSGNVMFGASGKGIRGCFCMGQGGLDARNGGRQYTKQNFADSITNMSMLGNEYNVTQSSLMTANFGPNPIMSTTYSVVAGIGNTAYGIHSSTVIGKSNVVGYHSNQGYYEYPSSDHGMFYADIFGESNMVFANGTFVMNTVHGGRNHVFTKVMTDSQIFGRENKIAERPVPAVMSCAQVKALQEQYEADSTIQLPTYIKMSDSGTIYEYNGSGMYRGTETVTADYIYKIDKENKYTGEPYGINLNRVWNDENDLDPNTSNYASEIHRLHVFGQKNWVHSYVMDYTVFGSANEITNSIAQADPYHPFGISNGFVQGNNNAVSNGSNIVCMGNGNVSTGHNSVAIGSQLISNQWQTVVGKYNEAVSGPSRVIDEYKTTMTYGLGEVVWHEDNYYECTIPVQVAGSWDATKWTVTNPERDKAIFIVGNGYSETDGSDWQAENKIHRSNAMTVYADGTVKARQFESDSDVTLAQGDGINITEANGQVTVSVKQSLANLEAFLTANPQPQSGTYVLGSVDGAWAWIQCNTTTIGA